MNLVCKNIKTDEVTEYPSMGNCATRLIMPKGLLDYYLNKLDRTKFVLNGKYVVIQKGEQWPILDDHVQPYYAIPNEWVIIDRDSKTTTIYKYLNNISMILGIDRKHLKSLIEREIIDNEKEGLKFGNRTLMPYDIWRNKVKRLTSVKDLREDMKNPTQGGSVPSQIEVENLETGEIRTWESSEKFVREVLHMAKKSFQRNVNRNKGYFCCKVPGTKETKKLYKVTYLSPTKE